MQFGTGPEFSAQCTTSSIPPGWRPWADNDGPIPNALSARANALAADRSVSLGATESYPLPGVTALIRIEPHIWARDPSGNLVQGCFRAGGIYLPSGAPPAAETVTPPTTGSGKLGTIVSVLTAASLTIGTIATVAKWKRS